MPETIKIFPFAFCFSSRNAQAFRLRCGRFFLSDVMPGNPFLPSSFAFRDVNARCISFTSRRIFACVRQLFALKPPRYEQNPRFIHVARRGRKEGSQGGVARRGHEGGTKEARRSCRRKKGSLMREEVTLIPSLTSPYPLIGSGHLYSQHSKSRSGSVFRWKTGFWPALFCWR